MQKPICSESTICGEDIVVNNPLSIVLYKNSAEVNKLDKTSSLKCVGELFGYVKKVTSIISPVIQIEIDDVNFNYVYFEEFKRYYFVKDIVTIRNKVWELYLKCDVLMSYLEEIKNTSAYISRNEFDFNKELNDSMLSYEYKKDVEETSLNVKYKTYMFPLNQVNGYFYVENKTKKFKEDSKYKTYIINTRLIENTVTLKVPNFKLTIPTLPEGSQIMPVCYSKDGFDANSIVNFFYYDEEGCFSFMNQQTPFIYFTLDSDSPNELLYTDEYDFNSSKKYYRNCVTTIVSKDYLYNIKREIMPVNNPVLSDVNSRLTSSISFGRSMITSFDQIHLITGETLSNDSLKNFIVSINTYPFEVPIDIKTDVQPIPIGNETPIAALGYLPYYNSAPYIKVSRFKYSRKFNDFRDYEPYSQYELYVPYANWVKLEADLILNCELELGYIPNYSSGEAYYFITDITHNKLIKGGACSLGNKIPVDATNARENEIAKATGYSSAAITALSSVVMVAIAALNPAISPSMATAMITGGVGGLFGGTLQASTTAANTEYTVGDVASRSSECSLYGPQRPRLRITRNITKTDYNSLSHIVGKPLNEVRTIGTLSGVTTIGEVHLDNFENATTQELQEIDSILKDSIII